MGDPNPQIVLAAVEALPDTNDSAALDRLRAASQHSDRKVRAAAAARLEELN